MTCRHNVAQKGASAPLSLVVVLSTVLRNIASLSQTFPEIIVL
jgi:hypothetical protein